MTTAFSAALSEVNALLGPASKVMRRDGVSLAEWDRGDGAVTLDDAEGHVVLAAIGADGDVRPSVVADGASDVESAVRDACAWLSWSTCARTGYDANGSPVDDERTAVYARLAEVSR